MAVLTPALLPLAALFLLVEKWHHGIGSRENPEGFQGGPGRGGEEFGRQWEFGEKILDFRPLVLRENRAIM